MEEKKPGSVRKAIRKQREISKAKQVSAFLFVFLCAVIAVVFLPGFRSALGGDTETLKSPLVIVQKPQLALSYPVRHLPQGASRNITDGEPESVDLVGYIATESTYKSNNVSIEIETVSKNDNTYFVAHISIKDFSLLKTGTYTNVMGKVVKSDVISTARQNEAVLAINSDFYTYRDSGNIIRNGEVILNNGWGETLCIYEDGSMDVVDGFKTDVYDLQAAGVVNSFNFGPAMIVDGEIVKENITGSIVRDAKHPRTGIGYYSPGEYLFICVDGRKQGYSVGMTTAEFAELFKEYGVELAYNFDGGGSTTMAFMGELVNMPQG
ncbi:MAG: phosphodiester glycosidase family protein, partial [Eubacteriales bacterium]